MNYSIFRQCDPARTLQDLRSQNPQIILSVEEYSFCFEVLIHCLAYIPDSMGEFNGKGDPVLCEIFKAWSIELREANEQAGYMDVRAPSASNIDVDAAPDDWNDINIERGSSLR